MNDKKIIKTAIRKQLKNQMTTWNRMNKKEKRQLCKQVMAEVKARYENNSLPSYSREELLNISSPPEEMMTLTQVRDMRQKITRTVVHYMDHRNTAYLDPELTCINELLDDAILNELLAPRNYTPAQRDKTPAMLFRAELLKSLCCAEMSYRKFCEREINDLERKKNRTFIGLPLHRNVFMHHTELCAFRKSLTMAQQLNVLVYIISLFVESDLVDDHVVWGVDATDLAAKMKTHPLAAMTLRINGKKEKIAIYDQLDTDCAERRNKSDRSRYYVGYKIHTLSAINPRTKMAYPLFSLLAPANHHDAVMLEPVLAFGNALGLDLHLLSVDEGYDSTDHAMMDRYDVTIVAPRRAKVTLPDHVDSVNEKARVYCHDLCSTPMTYVGREGGFHEFHCGDHDRECPFAMNCPRSRTITLDNGHFGPLPTFVQKRTELEDLRKVIERPFNYLKNRNCHQRITVKSQQSAQVVETISMIAVVLIEIAGQRKEKQIVNKQLELDLTG